VSILHLLPNDHPELLVLFFETDSMDRDLYLILWTCAYANANLRLSLHADPFGTRIGLNANHMISM
jgi:hypothetical protein